MPTPPSLPSLQIHQELHARVAEPVTTPCRIRHSAYLLPSGDPASRDAVRQRFEYVANGLSIPKENILWGERSGRVEAGLTESARLRVVWELHTEFYSYTTFHMTDPERNSESTLVPLFNFPAMPTLGTKLVDLDIVVMPGMELTETLRDFLGPVPLYGGMVVGGQARVWTTFHVDEWGQGRYVVRADSLGAGRVGRLIRRLVEIENYYHLILLPLEEYRALVSPLGELERRVAQRSQDVAAALAGSASGVEVEHEWLVSVTKDLADLTHLSERIRHKISAAESYYAILEERLRWLREQTGEGFQSLGEFLTARVAPAVRNYRNFTDRTHALALQITAIGNILRTRVNLSMERQSLATMRAMDRRFALQLQLQFTVEGLSIIVLSYYLTGLTGYALRALDAWVRLPGKPDLWIAASIPLWLGLAYLFARRVHGLVRTHMKEEGEKE